ncbi:SgcJ/EcaC family oxidoreductase [uncultured Sphingomonas sp.]
MSQTATLAPVHAAALADDVAPADHTAIQAILDSQTAAWDAHDMTAFVADMAPDVDWINVVGMHWHGREAVLRAHTAFHKMPMFAHSSMIPGPVEMRGVAPGVILVVDHTRLEGMGPTPGGGTYPTTGSIMTLVFIRQGGRWWIAHGHNTNVDAHAAAHDPSRPPG